MNFRKLSAAFLAGLIAGSTIQPAYARDIETDHEEIIGTDAAYLEGNVSQPDAADSGTSFELPIEVQFCQTEARTEFDMINEFRTGDDAWYWNEDNTEKVYVTGLKEIEYDYDLEKVAMQRAVEIAVYYSHSRPDGKSCWDTYDDLGYNWVSTVGENIAAGYRTAEAVFIGWREDDDDYSGQGHRRNMLNSAFQAVGLGCVYYEGYYYWVQEFAGKALNTTETTAKDELSIESVAISNENADVWQLSTDTLNIDNTQEYDISELMSVNYKLKIAGWSPQARVRKSKYIPDWQPEDTSVVTFRDGKLKGLKSGSTVMNGLSPDGGTELKVTVNVTAVHTWGEPSYAWSDDNSKVTASVKCTDCDETIEETVSTTYEVIKEPTCDEKGTGRYTAAFTNELFTTQTKDVEIDAVGHDYELSTWEWAEDYSSAQAVFVCANDESHTETVNATVSSVRTEPTCDQEGSIVYTASVTFEGNTYTDTKSVVLEKTDHVYGEPVYTWAADFSTVTAKAVCTVCGDEVTETVNTTYEVIKAPTCVEEGTGLYTAEFTNSLFTKQTKEGTIPAAGHDYKFSAWEWSEDYSSAKAVFVCANDESHTEKVNASVTSVRTEPTCAAEGSIVYTATVAFEGNTYTDTKSVVLEKTDHVYGEPVYTWAADFSTVTAKAVCTVCGDEVTETVNTTYEVIKASTAEEDGTGRYTAVFTNEMFETQTKDIILPATGHTYGTPEYTWSEDNKTVTAVVKCTDCDREITETVDTVYEVIKAPGCEEKGTGRYSAYFANELFTTQTKDVEIDAIGHNYGEPEYTWAVDFKTVTAKAVCENCGDEITETVETTYEVIREATLEETGTGKYTAVFTNEMFETQTKEVEIPALSDKSPKEIHIDQSELSILCNASVKLNAEVLPEDAEDKTVTWSSSDESVAIVGANGTVRGIKPGKVTITATTVNGLTDTCEIRVLFTDVAIRSRYYYTPVYWAFDRNITVGYGGVDLFSPDYSVTRGQFVTFLYRLAGEPEVTEDSGFDDVDPAKFYAKSIAWAAANGITTGYAGRNEFGPDDKCTREQIVTFLWRYAESPKPEKAVNFTDSRPNAYYLDALSWAAEKEITVGLNDGTGRFGVGMNCTRGMTVTFLYRFDQNK